MCLSVPARVLAVHDRSWATVDIAGTTKRISIDLIDGVHVDDWVLLHVGFALEKIDEAAARETLALFDAFAAGDAPEPDAWAAMISSPPSGQGLG